MTGFLLIDKPSGITSYDVIRRIKKQYPKGTKIGHGGTLDPLASGLLIIGIGREATKKLGEFLKCDKTYEVIAVLGKSYDTYDITGKLLKEKTTEGITLPRINEVLKGFVGESKQVPPMFSALKHKGTPLYKLARKGVEVERQPRSIVIQKIENVSWKCPYLSFAVTCSGGMYVRSLVSDIGEKLGCGAAVSKLHRTRIADLLVDDAINLDIKNEPLL